MNSARLVELADELARKVLERSHLPEDEVRALYDLGYRFAHSTRDLIGPGLDGSAILRREIILETLAPDERDFMCAVAHISLLAHEIGLQPRDLFADLVSRIRQDYRRHMHRLLGMGASELARDFQLLRVIESDGSVLVKMKPVPGVQS